MIHVLKTKQPFFNDVMRGHKHFEIRKNDRDFAMRDILILEEYPPRDGERPRQVQVEVIYITDFEQKKGYVVMGIRAP